ncbi:MAG: hypothetical protein ABI574_12980 [Burkholderiales bacterium]
MTTVSVVTAQQVAQVQMGLRTAASGGTTVVVVPLAGGVRTARPISQTPLEDIAAGRAHGRT